MANQNWLGLGHAAFVQKSWLDCGKSLCSTQNWGPPCVFCGNAALTKFVPHIVGTVPQNWLGLGHAAFVQKSWLDCGKSLYHTKHGVSPWFFAAMLHSLFVPHIVTTVPQNWLGLGHAAFVQKSGWTVVNHYYTQNWVQPCVFCGNAALTVCAPHCGAQWPQCWGTNFVSAALPQKTHGEPPQFLCNNDLAQSNHGHCLHKLAAWLTFEPVIWTVVNHYCTQNWGLTMSFLRQCCTHMFVPHIVHCAPKLARSWPCSLCAEVMTWTVVKACMAHRTGVSPVLRQCCTHSGPTL